MTTTSRNFGIGRSRSPGKQSAPTSTRFGTGSREDPARGARAVYVALGVRADGTKEVLGLWIEQTEGAKFWLRVMNKLRDRGVQDILIAVVDGLKGFPEAIGAVFPP